MNKVVLIGESHYHGLGLARSYGIKGIKPYGIVVGSNTPGSIEASRYWKKVYHVADNDMALDLAIRLFGSEAEKPVLLPWSDGALFAVDRRMEELSRYFILSSIRGTAGEIGRQMNKKRQAELAQRFGLTVSPTEEIALPLQEADIERINETMTYPLFLKPVDSREGSKKDMRKISSSEEFLAYSRELQQKGYFRVLVQEYLDIDVEFDLMGFCNGHHYSYTVARKKRTWPISGGAACYGQVISPGEYKAQYENIIRQLASLGYAGPFDLDLFKVGDRLYFNEINWRSSANVFAAVKSGNNYPYEWYRSVTEDSYAPSEDNGPKEIYFMNEFRDYHHVLAKKISVREWMRDVKRTDSFAFSDRSDRRPFQVQIRNTIAGRLLPGKKEIPD